jgi:raffinose/stachyose/melibiose transport system substrate-binding protein
MRNPIGRTLVAIAAVALVAPLAACAGAGGGSSDGVVEIDFFHRWPNEPKNAYFTELVEEFEAENPISV